MKLFIKTILIILFTLNFAKSEILKIGIDPDYFPFATIIPTKLSIYNACAYGNNSPGFKECNKKHLPYKGADIDLALYLCNRMEVQCEFIHKDFNRLIPELKDAKFDVIVSAMSIKPERQIEIDFSIPYFVFSDGSATGIGIRKNRNALKVKINNTLSEAINNEVIKKISMRYWKEDFTPK